MLSMRCSRRVVAVFAVLIASLPFAVTDLSAAVANLTNLVGPNSPPLADTPGNGFPNAATDTAIGLNRVNDTVTITSPWTCNGSSVKNQITLSDPDMSGRFLRGSRFSENLGKTQRITITGFDGSGEPTQFLFEELTGSSVTRSGVGTLISSQNNGVYDTMELSQTGGGILATLSFSYFNTGNGNSPNFVSFPWGQTAALGGKSACAGGNPQVFLPVASNGHVIFDLDGNGSPDPDLFPSPLIAPSGIAAVPALAPAGAALLAAALLAVAVRHLRRVAGEPAGSGPRGA